MEYDTKHSDKTANLGSKAEKSRILEAFENY
jgi:hypothetical protein